MKTQRMRTRERDSHRTVQKLLHSETAGERRRPLGRCCASLLTLLLDCAALPATGGTPAPWNFMARPALEVPGPARTRLTQVWLTWTHGAGNAFILNRYELERSPNGTSGWEEVAKTGWNPNPYAHPDRTPVWSNFEERNAFEWNSRLLQSPDHGLWPNQYFDRHICTGHRYWYRLRAYRYNEQIDGYIFSGYRTLSVRAQGNEQARLVDECVPGTLGPTLRSAEVDPTGKQITMRFRESLSVFGPNVADFTVKVDGTALNSDMDIEEIQRANSTTLDHVLKSAVPAIRSGQSVTISYSDPTPRNDVLAIQDTKGVDARSFTDVAVENKSTVANAQMAPPSDDPLTVSLDEAPASHDGESRFHVRIAFSEGLRNSYRTFARGFEVTNGAVTGVKRVDRRDDLWRVTIEPSGDEDITLTLAGGRACSVAGAPCTNDRRTLSETLTVTVPGPVDENALTASVVDQPLNHDGTGEQFELEVAFSEAIANSYRHVDDAASVTGGQATSAKRKDGRPDRWLLRVVPSGNGPVTVTLPGGGTCGSDHPAVLCTSDGRALSNSPSISVAGPWAISVADARAHESDDATIDFTVSLDRTALKTITVEYATQDGSAKAGEDYTAKSGTLTFSLGQRSKTVRVPLLDDAIDEGEETFALVLSNPSAGARIADGEAVGTIENDDPLQQAWIARFGRTVATQAADAVGRRLSGSTQTQITVGGQALAFGEPSDTDALAEAEANARTEAMATWLRGGVDEVPNTGAIGGHGALLASSFSISGGGENGGARFGAWGRVGAGSFEGEEQGLQLSGEVTTVFLGADIDAGRWLGGAAVGRSDGEGPFELTNDAGSNRSGGIVESTLTALYPYARLSLNDRVDLWALGGFGSGNMTLTRDTGVPTQTDISMTMGVLGVEGNVLRPPPDGGLALNLKSDVLHVRMASEAAATDAGNLEPANAEVTRLRLILEGERPYAIGHEETLTPALDVGLRHDAGDAETGTGVEVGARIAYARAGISMEGAVRALAAHEDAAYEEWGASASVRVDPGESGRGLSLTITPTWGNAGSGTEQLWGARDARALAPENGVEAGRRLESEVGYGFGAGLDVVTPFAGLGLADGGERTLRLGARWAPTAAADVHLQGMRSEAPGGDADHRVGVTFSARW